MGESQVYTVMTSRVGDMPSWLRDAVLYVSTPAIVVPVILLLLWVWASEYWYVLLCSTFPTLSFC